MLLSSNNFRLVKGRGIVGKLLTLSKPHSIENLNSWRFDSNTKRGVTRIYTCVKPATKSLLFGAAFS